jgi:hypothetical protein
MLVRTYALFMLALTTSAFLHGQSGGQNLLPNGGFEVPGMPANQNMQLLTNKSTFVPGWIAIDDGVGQPPFYGNTDLNDAVLNGEYGIVLNQGSGLKTSFPTDVGAFYEFSIWLRPDDCLSCDTPAPLRVNISGTVYHLALASGWTFQTIQFVSAAPVNTLEIFNPSSPRDYKRFSIDDLAIRKVPGAILSAQLRPVVTVEGILGAKYQIQSATNLTAPMWTTLTNLTLSNNPTFFMDTNSFTPSAPFHRIYRAVRIQ